MCVIGPGQPSSVLHHGPVLQSRHTCASVYSLEGSTWALYAATKTSVQKCMLQKLVCNIRNHMGLPSLPAHISEPWVPMRVSPLPLLYFRRPLLVCTNHRVQETPQRTCCFGEVRTQLSSQHNLAHVKFAFPASNTSTSSTDSSHAA